MKQILLLLISIVFWNTILLSQWKHRYPKIDNMNNPIYLEGYELPTLSMGPIDPAISPDNLTIAFSSRGWIWLFEIGTGIAKRLTDSGNLDFRPTWSPDGLHLAFVRDDGNDTWIVIYDILTGKEKIINSRDDASAACNDYLRVLGLISLAYSWLKILDISYKELSNNKGFFEDKIATANFFFNRVLPRVDSYYKSAISGSEYIMKFMFK